MYRTSTLSLLAFLALAVAIRWGSFFISVINHDESTYIVVADELLRGETYLRDVIDTKPIGIFWIYAPLVKLTGGSIPLLRLAAALVVGLGGWLLSLTAFRATRIPTAGYVAGVVYIIMCSVYTYYGMSPNTEIYFNLFTIGAVALTVASASKWWFPAGLLLGVAFAIKPFAAAEALAIGLYLVWFYRREWPRMIRNGLLLVGGFLVPVAGVVAYFASQGLLGNLYFYSVEVAAAYAVDLPWGDRLKYLGDYCLRYSPFLLLGGIAQVRALAGQVQEDWMRYLLLQAALVTLAVLLTGKTFGHYQIQLHPVVALYAGSCVTEVFVDLRVGGVKAVKIAVEFPAPVAQFEDADDASGDTAGPAGPSVMDGHEIAGGLNILPEILVDGAQAGIPALQYLALLPLTAFRVVVDQDPARSPAIVSVILVVRGGNEGVVSDQGKGIAKTIIGSLHGIGFLPGPVGPPKEVGDHGILIIGLIVAIAAHQRYIAGDGHVLPEIILGLRVLALQFSRGKKGAPRTFADYENRGFPVVGRAILRPGE